LKNVFIIDDDHDDQGLLIEALMEINESLLFFKADNGLEAMKKLISGDIPLPDVIFVDLNMPLVNGKQFLSKIKAEDTYKTIPIIVYSTSEDKIETNQLIEMGAAYFIKKPSNFKSLKKELERVFHSVLHKPEVIEQKSLI